MSKPIEEKGSFAAGAAPTAGNIQLQGVDLWPFLKLVKSFVSINTPHCLTATSAGTSLQSQMEEDEELGEPEEPGSSLSNPAGMRAQGFL